MSKEDRELTGIKRAVSAAKKCYPANEKMRPKVGAVVIRDDEIVCEAYSGEISGEHAECIALINKCKDMDLTGGTLITTMEPCTTRSNGKRPCISHIIEKGIKKVIIGTTDPNPEIRGNGILSLKTENIYVEFFPPEYEEEVRKLNKGYWFI